MPAELSILTRYPCQVDGCGKYFRMKHDYDAHNETAHKIQPLASPEGDIKRAKGHEIECTYANCYKLFATESEMRLHKETEPEHDYCRKCDFDCKDWEDYMKHKIESSHHICCPVCALDFNSTGGMERHVKLAHQRDHKLVCVGCNQIFARAGTLIEHLERGRCRNKIDPQKTITKEKFQDCLNHKLVIDHIMSHENPEQAFTGPSNQTRTASSSLPFSATATNWDGSQADENRGGNDDGGVLLDAKDEVQAESFPSLAPSKVKTTGNSSLIGSHNYRSSRDYNKTPSDLTYASITRSSTVQRGTSSPKQDKVPALESTTSSKAPASSYGFTTPGTRTKGTWDNTSESSKTLFPDAKPISTPFSFEAGLKERNEEYARKYLTSAETADLHPSIIDESKAQHFVEANAAVSGKSISLRSLFWHPENPGFSAESFFDRVISKYCCPIKPCPFQTDTPTELSHHLKGDIHKASSYRCPVCMRIFKNPTALIQHCESPSVRCYIRLTDQYGKFMDKVSGGFINVQRSFRQGGQSEVSDGGDGNHAIGLEDRAKIVERIRRHEPRYEVARPEGFW